MVHRDCVQCGTPSGVSTWQAADWYERPTAEKQFDRLLAALPDRAWIE